MKTSWKMACGTLLGLAVIVAGGMKYTGSTEAVSVHLSALTPTQNHFTPPPLEQVQRLGRDTIVIPADIVQKMGLNVGAATAAKHAVALPSFQGVLALDNERFSRVHSRFEGEVVEIGHRMATDATSSPAPFRVGDRVEKGDLLAVIWSTNLGQKKSELVDAIAKLHSEEDLRDRLKKLYEEGAGSGRTYRDAEKAVQSLQVEVANAERTLRTWRVTESNIAEVKAEAERLIQAEKQPEEQSDWARVEVRAPRSGVIVEKNIAMGDIVDTATDLFKIGDLSQLSVWAHVYEEDLPLLESLPRPIQWTVGIPSRSDMHFPGSLDRIGDVIDPAQHTALVVGKVNNSAGDLKIGQFVTVTIERPSGKDELEIPATSVVQNGADSVVFVQSSANSNEFLRRPVQVVRRFRNVVYIQANDQSIQAGDMLITTGTLMVQNAIEQLPPPVGHIAGTPTSTAEAL